jgi:hypothetical protein
MVFHGWIILKLSRNGLALHQSRREAKFSLTSRSVGLNYTFDILQTPPQFLVRLSLHITPRRIEILLAVDHMYALLVTFVVKLVFVKAVSWVKVCGHAAPLAIVGPGSVITPRLLEINTTLAISSDSCRFSI